MCACACEKAPILVGTSMIECVDAFTYLGSVVTSNARMDAEVDRCIASASRAFGALRQAVFKDSNLDITTKRRVYQTCVLSVLLYGSECWVPLRRHLKRLNGFHHRCICTVLGITNLQQWQQHITSQMTREQWGDLETVETKVVKHRHEWLGHLARMPDHRIPKQTLFGWLPQPRLQGGPQRRWRDLIRRDLKAVGVPEEEWYVAALSRASWHETYRQGLEHRDQQQPNLVQPQSQVQCPVCRRCFRREGDRARHKCTAERQKPVWEHRGAVQCPNGSRWFCSVGGLTVHRCGPQQPSSTGPTTRSSTRQPSRPPGPVQCQVCERWFRRPSDRARHKCLEERALPVECQRGSVQRRDCDRWSGRGSSATMWCNWRTRSTPPKLGVYSLLPHQ